MSDPYVNELKGLIDDCRNWQMVSIEDNIGWLALDKQGSTTNVLSQQVLQELEAIVAALSKAPLNGLVIYSAKDNGFVAGADINEFPKIDSQQKAYEVTRRGQAIFEKLESLPFPTVAVINGFALGGGLELALACDWRVALKEDRPTLGFPEVQLGLHPGFGGTVRAVRLLGVRQAMPLMLTGKSITASKAARIGLVDRLTDAIGWRDTALSLAKKAAPKRQPPLLDRLMNLNVVRSIVARNLRANVARKARKDHYPAPFAMVELWRRFGAGDEAAYVAEAKSFAALSQTNTSRNLIRVYFLQENLKRAAPDDRSTIGHIHVIGAGVMGGDIASWCALQGFSVTLQDRTPELIQPALERSAELFQKRLSDPENLELTRKRLVADVTGEGIGGADVVIEAIFEDRDVKQTLYQQIEPRMRRDAVLATNTSSIPLEELSPCLAHPERLIGLHFFNPVAKLPLVEVVTAAQSSLKAIARGLALTREIRKLPLPCRSHPGFLVNRTLAPYMAEAMELLREGVPATVIDQAAVDFGMPVGPLELVDSVGADIALNAARILAPVVGRPVAPELEEMVSAGHLGQKTGQGFYTYPAGRPKPEKRPANPAATELTDRLILTLLNEAVASFADGVVDNAGLVDAGIIFGTGFAPFRGGPIQYAKQRGIDNVIDALRQLEDRHGDRFRPSKGWQALRE